MKPESNAREQFEDLLVQQRPREALRLLLDHLDGKTWADLDAPIDVPMLCQLCQKLLPVLLGKHTRWLLSNPDSLEQLKHWLEQMVTAARYNAPTTLEQIAWIRCLLALSALLRKDLDAAHKEICQSQSQKAKIPRPNGQLEQVLRELSLLDGAAGVFLKTVWTCYAKCLQEMGQHEFAYRLALLMGPLIAQIETDESRPGVVRALFYNPQTHAGYSRLVHVGLTLHGTQASKIAYARDHLDKLDMTARQTADRAFDAADHLLKQIGYPDGLASRHVRWEISTLPGEPTDAPRTFEGASLGLPLTVAIISVYLGQPIPQDTALTGIIAPEIEENQDIPLRSVDGIEAKLRRALQDGCRRIFIPAGNLAGIEESPALVNTAQQAQTEIRSVSNLQEVCREIFPPVGSGRIADLVKDAFQETMRFFRRTEDPIQLKARTDPHRWHVLLSAAFLFVVFCIDALRHHLVFAADYPWYPAMVRMACAMVIGVSGLLFSYGIIRAALYHRAKWAWFATIFLMAVTIAIAFQFQDLMLPDTPDIGQGNNWPVWVGLAKDGFVYWLYTCILLTNTYAVIAGLEYLIHRHQHITARHCLSWESLIEDRMPIRVINYPWSMGLLAFFVGGFALFILECWYYVNLKPGLTAVYWDTLLGVTRDMVLIAAAAEVMVFFKVAQNQVRSQIV